MTGWAHAGEKVWTRASRKAHVGGVDDLSKLSPEDLIRIIREQARRIEWLQSEIERLKKRLSASPFSRGTRKKNPKRPGRKAGQGRFRHREAPTAKSTRTVRVPVREPKCPFCGGEWGERKEEVVTNTDLPTPPPAEVHTFLVEVCRCQKCGKTTRGQHPEVAADQYGATAHRVGERAKAVAHTLHYGWGVPQRKVPTILQALCGLQMTQGALNQDAQRKTGGVVGAAYRQLRAEMPHAPVVHTDDTGWRIGGASAHLMVFTHPQTTVFQVRWQHRNEEVREVLGDHFAGVLECDRGKSYDAEELRGIDQQKCLSHLIRNAREIEQRQGGRARQFPRRLKKLLQKGLALGRCRQQLPSARFEKRAAAFERQMTKLLRDRLLGNLDNQRLLNGVGAQHDRGNVLRFLRDPHLEPTNNRAERALRPAVIRRKVSHCSKSLAGARAFEAFLSVIQTFRQRSSRSLIPSLFDLFRSSRSAAPP